MKLKDFGIAGYARVSTREQAENQYALKQQKARLEDAISRLYPGKDFEIFFDIESGNSATRAQYNRMLNLVKQGKITTIFATRWDRLTRNQLIFLHLKEILRSSNTSLQLLDQIDPEGEFKMTEISPPQLSKPYSESVKRRCVSMYQLGYSLTQIKQFTGVSDVVKLRHWLKEEGIYKSAKDYSVEQKQQCSDLYLSGKTPLEIEEEMRVSGFVISGWIHSSGIPTRPKEASYSDKQQKLAMSMYVKGESYSEIKSTTGILPHRVEKLAKLQKLQRQKKPKAGRPTIYSSEFKQTCLDLLAKGKTPMQIEQLMGVHAASVRRWRRDYIAQQNSNF